MARKVTISTEHADFIKSNYKDMSVITMSNRTGLSQSMIYNNMIALGLECRNAYSRKIDTDLQFFNESKFENWIV